MMNFSFRQSVSILLSFFIREKNGEKPPSLWRFWHNFVVVGIVLVSILIQVWNIHDPYWLALETGFQEIIARRHLDPGLRATWGLSTLNNLGTEPTFHATHPPLLQLTLAGLYRCLGDSEAVARLIPLASFFALLLGIWKLTKSLSPHARIGALAATAFSPLSFYIGRIVNFEAPCIACIVWSLVCIESMKKWSSWLSWTGLMGLGIGGTLIDWPYPLFVMCLFLLSWFRKEEGKRYLRPVFVLWVVSMSVACMYGLVLYQAGVLEGLRQHVQIQTGTRAADQQIQLPPVLVSWQWWQWLILRLAQYETPVFLFTFLGWLFVLGYRKCRSSLDHATLILFVTCAIYIGLFSRASHNHLWCLFYMVPVFGLGFGLVIDRFRPWIGYLLLLVALGFAIPVTWEFRTKTPLRDSVQAGKILSAAMEEIPKLERTHRDGPLLYVNRVDSLPYYAGYETAFSHLSVRVAAPHKFLIRFRPEFVVLSGYKTRSSVTVRPEYPQELFDRLQKSYTLVHQQENIEMWESLWSPYISIMGMLHTKEGVSLPTDFVDDLDEVHVGSRMDATQSPVEFDLRNIRKPGRRWLHGWVIATRCPDLDPISISLRKETREEMGTIQAIPQKDRPRWQEFWLPIGDLPDRLELSWSAGTLLLGDFRLYNEVLWAQDLTQVLASEIRRRLGTHPYRETLPVPNSDGKRQMVMQHPGFGVDRVELPLFRTGLNQELRVTYGLLPAAYAQSDGVAFRLYIQDHALGRRDLLFEEFIDPHATSPQKEWHTRIFPLREYSRHVVGFTCEVDPGPKGDSNSDQAVWQEIRIVNPK